jgi:hypothetical protein
VPSPAFLELQRLVRHMTEELASFRRRAIQAEGRVRELEHALTAAEARAAGADDAPAPSRPARARRPDEDAATHTEPGRLATLEQENARLRQRLDGATERTRQLLDRMRFLRQQQEQEMTR